jgi:hypothetical protein
MLCKLGRKILRRIYCPTPDKGRWPPRWHSEIYNLYRDLNILNDIQIRRLGRAGHITRMEGEKIPKEVLSEKLHNTRPMGTPKNKFGGRRLDGHITDPIQYEDRGGGHGPEGAVDPQMDRCFDN